MRERPPKRAAVRPQVGFVGRLIDRAIREVAPGWAARRDRARWRGALADSFFGRAGERAATFEMAGSDRTRGENWLASKLSPDSILQEDLETLRQRSNDLYKQDGYYAGAVESWVANVIGCGIRPQANVAEIAGVLTADQARALNDRLEELWDEWGEGATVDGLSIIEAQTLVARSERKDGESFVILSDLARADSLIPLQLEVVDAERCQSPTAGDAKPEIRLGIERDKLGRRVAYHFRETHPGDQFATQKFRRLEADRVCHVYEPASPAQSRGWPWCWSVGGRLKDIKEVVDATVITEQVAACFTGFVKTQIDPFEAADSAATGSADGQRLEDFEPGRINYLAPNEDITFADPHRLGGTMAPFIESGLRYVAAGLNFPYELLAKDYSRTNYSSGRLSLIEGRLNFRRAQQRIVGRFLLPVWRRFVRELVIVGALEEFGIDADRFNVHERELSAAKFVSPGWPWIDPTKEVQADLAAVNGNLVTLAEVLASRGLDLDETLRQRGRERELEVEYGCAPVQQPGAIVAEDGNGTPAGPAADEEGDEADVEEPAPVASPTEEGAP